MATLTGRGLHVTDGRYRLACKAFETVFQRRQTQHGILLKWIRGELRKTRMCSEREREMLEGACAWGQRRGEAR